jgi:hypothetical protein
LPQEFRIDVLVAVLAHAAPAADQGQHLVQSRERIFLQRLAVGGPEPEDRDRRRRADRKTVLAPDAVGLVLGPDARDIGTGLSDDLRHAIAHALPAPRAPGLIHDKL